MILRNLMPVPVSVAAKAGEFHFGAEATLRVNAPLLTEGMIEEYKGLWKRYGMRKNALRVVRDERLQENCAVLCAEENACPALSAGDEYALTVTEKGAFVRGESAVGLLHGLFTLVQLVVPVALDDRPDYALPAVEIHDHPAIAGMRAIHLCVFPETKLSLPTRCPTRASRYAQGTSTTSCRMNDTIIEYTLWPSAWKIEPSTMHTPAKVKLVLMMRSAGSPMASIVSDASNSDRSVPGMVRNSSMPTNITLHAMIAAILTA